MKSRSVYSKVNQLYMSVGIISAQLALEGYLLRNIGTHGVLGVICNWELWLIIAKCFIRGCLGISVEHSRWRTEASELVYFVASSVQI